MHQVQFKLLNTICNMTTTQRIVNQYPARWVIHTPYVLSSNGRLCGVCLRAASTTKCTPAQAKQDTSAC